MYDGARYRGWQRLADSGNTIQGRLEETLSRMTGETVTVSGSGRTDAGVHALGQVVSFRLEREVPCTELLAGLRSYLPEDIGAVSVEKAPERFHARLSAKEKVYRYRIWNSAAPCVFERRYVYVLPDRLDVERMRAAAALLCGTHSYLAFCSNKHFKKSPVRTVSAIDIRTVGSELQITMTADGFLYNMARIITGTLIEAGRGDRNPEDIPLLFEEGRREQAGYTVPACGLCLMEVRYE